MSLQRIMEQTAQHHADEFWMSEALRLALKGQGFVEPNPLVGCVIVQPDGERGRQVGQGYHEKFGEPHAEVNALKEAAENARGATVYVSLEPCVHSGKTPPCADALIQAQVSRVVIGARDPFREVDGKGIERLISAGIEVTTGMCANAAADLIRPFVKRVTHNLPWVIAKWAMTLDGKIASATGDSQWISNANSRKIVHQLRGRVDAIMVGSGTVLKDNPLLTARPGGAKIATRIVLDSTAKISLESKLVKSVGDAPVLIAVGPEADAAACKRLEDAGCEIWRGKSFDVGERLRNLLLELGNRGLTNVLVEGGGQLLGSLAQMGQIDEIHAFVAPKILGGKNALTPVEGSGFDFIADVMQFSTQSVQLIDGDVYMIARVVE